MKLRALILLGFSLLVASSAFALEHAQKNGLFRMDIPEGWHWFDYQEEIIVTYPDAKSVALDIQFIPSQKLSFAEIKKLLKDGNDKMIKEGIMAHHGKLIDEKEIRIDGVYATQLVFNPAPQNPIQVSYISFFSDDYAFTITYGSADEKMNAVLDDVVGTIKLKQ